jgi:hypothetical protein
MWEPAWLCLLLLVAAPLTRALPCLVEDTARYAWITPILGNISPACCQASQKYIRAFGVPDDLSLNMTWGLQQLDANGRLPLEGFLSDAVPFPLNLCDLLGESLPGCRDLPPALTSVSVTMVIGFGQNPGSMDNCLKSKTDGFNSRYCTVSLKKPEEKEESGGGRVEAEDHFGLSYFGRMAAHMEDVQHWRRLKTEIGQDEGGGRNLTGMTEFQEHVEHLYYLADSELPTLQQVHSHSSFKVYKCFRFLASTFPSMRNYVNLIKACASLRNALWMTLTVSAAEILHCTALHRTKLSRQLC